MTSPLLLLVRSHPESGQAATAVDAALTAAVLERPIKLVFVYPAHHSPPMADKLHDLAELGAEIAYLNGDLSALNRLLANSPSCFSF